MVSLAVECSSALELDFPNFTGKTNKSGSLLQGLSLIDMPTLFLVQIFIYIFNNLLLNIYIKSFKMHNLH